MAGYDRLAEFLASHKGDNWDASFAEIERVLGRTLPPSASRYPAWWANQSGGGHSQTRGWRSVGWKTAALDLERRRVRFERERRGAAPVPPETPPNQPNLDALIDRAGRLIGETDRDVVVRIALEALIAREAARQLGALGGTMPDYAAPARERP